MARSRTPFVNAIRASGPRMMTTRQQQQRRDPPTSLHALIADREIEQAGLVGELADAALFPLLALGQLLLEVFDVGQDLCAVFPPCHDVPPGWCVLFWRALA